MNLALSDEQEFLREAARGALSRIRSVEAARDALEGTALPDLWPLAVEAGWPGLLVSEDDGGAGLGVFVVRLQINHQHAQRHAHLDCGEADAGGIVHCLEHVFDQRL